MLRKMILDKVKQYRDLLDIIEGIKQVPIDGRLNISNKKKYFQYYLIKNGPNGREKIYLKKEDLYIAKELAQQDYLNQLRDLLIKRISLFSKVLEKFNDDELLQVFDNLSPARQAIVTPLIDNYDKMVKKWKAHIYKSKGFYSNTFKIYSKKGERVRSKSEKILADIFYDYGIEYKYECPLRFDNGVVLHPDFTFLNKDGVEIYWEHHGMMDDPSYVHNFIEKLKLYEQHGITRRKNLVITYESSTNVLDCNWVKSLIKIYELEK